MPSNATTCVFQQNIRQFERREAFIPVCTNDGNEQEEFILNYSSGGCCISSPVGYKKDETVLIVAPEAPADLNRSGRGYRIGIVVWERPVLDGVNNYGIRFADVN